MTAVAQRLHRAAERLVFKDMPAFGPDSRSSEWRRAAAKLTGAACALLVFVAIAPPLVAFFFRAGEPERWLRVIETQVELGYALIVIYAAARGLRGVFARFEAGAPFDPAVARAFRGLALFLAPFGIAGCILSMALFALSKWPALDGGPIDEISIAPYAFVAILLGVLFAALSTAFAEAARMKDDEDHTV